MSALPAAAPILLGELSGADTRGRFLLSAIAFLRSRQIKDGAIARVPRDGHKPNSIAILEVLADTISWSTVPGPLPR